MADTRPTHEITTPVDSRKVVVRDWINGGEKRKLGGTREENVVSLINAVVVSIDDKTEDLLATIDAMHGKDFDFLLAELTTITENSSYQKKMN
jgi:hypothetical protein